MSRDPWFKSKLSFQFSGSTLSFDVPHDVFSTQQIDDGTVALLEHLPEFEPSMVLDMGCGYGALGLPIAQKYPRAQVHLVDRDRLAAHWSARNASLNQLANVRAYPSLGFRDVDADLRFDWLLCNVPARIGSPFMEDLLWSGLARLAPAGEIRVVVIRDLGPTLDALTASTVPGLRCVFEGARHLVYSLRNSSSIGDRAPADLMKLYRRDTIRIDGLSLERPFDISGDSVRIEKALPLLLDALPRRAPNRALCFKSGYGALALVCRHRWPDTEVVACDRDLLAEAFLIFNAQKSKLDGSKLLVQPAHDLSMILAEPTAHFDLILGEVSSACGSVVLASDLKATQQLIAPGGQVLLLGPEKFSKDILKPLALKCGMEATVLMSRNGYTVTRI